MIDLFFLEASRLQGAQICGVLISSEHRLLVSPPWCRSCQHLACTRVLPTTVIQSRLCLCLLLMPCKYSAATFSGQTFKCLKILSLKYRILRSLDSCLSAGLPPELSNQVCAVVGTKHETYTNHNCLEITMLAWVITYSVIMTKVFHGSCKILTHSFPDATWSAEEEALIAEFQAILATTPRNALVVTLLKSHNIQWTFIMLNAGLSERNVGPCKN